MLGDWWLQLAITWWRFLLAVSVSSDTPVHACLIVDYKCSVCEEERMQPWDLGRYVPLYETHRLMKRHASLRDCEGGPLPLSPINTLLPLVFVSTSVCGKNSCMTLL